VASKLPYSTPGVLEKLIESAGASRYDTSGRLIEKVILTPRRAGKSSMADLMITGYNSEDASRHGGGHEGYVDELLVKQGKPPKYGKPKPIANPIRQYTHTPLTPKQMEDYMEAPAGTDMDAQLADLVAQYGDAFAQSPQAFSLTAPMKLITKKGKEYRNTAFIGGEDFRPSSAYIGKKGQTLIMLRPTDPSDFEYLEVPEKQCAKVFGAGFTTYLRETLKDVLEQKEELAAQASRQNEIARNAGAMKLYEGFGSW
jgi:hypothetical protein